MKKSLTLSIGLLIFSSCVQSYAALNINPCIINHSAGEAWNMESMNIHCDNGNDYLISLPLIPDEEGKAKVAINVPQLPSTAKCSIAKVTVVVESGQETVFPIDNTSHSNWNCTFNQSTQQIPIYLAMDSYMSPYSYCMNVSSTPLPTCGSSSLKKKI